MEEAGVGGLSMSEIARRLGMRQPSPDKYFPSLVAMVPAWCDDGRGAGGIAAPAAAQAPSRVR